MIDGANMEGFRRACEARHWLRQGYTDAAKVREHGSASLLSAAMPLLTCSWKKCASNGGTGGSGPRSKMHER